MVNTKFLKFSFTLAVILFFPCRIMASCSFINGSSTGNVNFSLPALTYSLNPSDVGPKLLSTVTVSASSLASSMGIASTTNIFNDCNGALMWNPLLKTIAGTSPNHSGYMSTGIDNLVIYMYAGDQTTGTFGPFVTPETDGKAWSRMISTISGSLPSWSTLGDVVLALYQTGPIRQGGVIPAGQIAELKMSDGLPLINMYMNSIMVNVLACTITTPVVNVHMPSFFKSSFNGTGDVSPSTEFKIGANCDSGIIPTITFSGQSSNSISDIFNINNVTGSASGVGFQILYQNIPVNQNEEIEMKKTTEFGVTEFLFSTRYIQTSNNIVSGQADATITFTLNYK